MLPRVIFGQILCRGFLLQPRMCPGQNGGQPGSGTSGTHGCFSTQALLRIWLFGAVLPAESASSCTSIVHSQPVHSQFHSKWEFPARGQQARFCARSGMITCDHYPVPGTLTSERDHWENPDNPAVPTGSQLSQAAPGRSGLGCTGAVLGSVPRMSLGGSTKFPPAGV